jgi:GT2 family glycosyltransferase
VTTELIVVDRHSTDSSLKTLSRYPTVRVLHERPESGLVAGYTVAAREAQYPLLFFCNEDLYLGERCLWELARRIDVNQRIWATDPWQWTYDGATWVRGGICYRRSPWHIYSPFPFRMHECPVDLPDGAPTPFGGAGAMMVDAGVFHELGGWDTSFFLDYEDIDIFIRAWQRDWTCITVPAAHTFHAIGASNKQVIGPRRETVSRRRYIAQRANVSIVAFKYFSPAVATVGLLNWLAGILVNVVLLRWRRIWLDLCVAADFARRLPKVLAFRKQNRSWNRAKPGEGYFLDPQFNLDSRVNRPGSHAQPNPAAVFSHNGSPSGAASFEPPSLQH